MGHRLVAVGPRDARHAVCRLAGEGRSSTNTYSTLDRDLSSIRVTRVPQRGIEEQTESDYAPVVEAARLQPHLLPAPPSNG